MELAELNLGHCKKLRELPEQLGDMKTLKKINASYPAVEKLPDSITRLKELAELNVEFCKLRELPEQFGELKSLKKLGARGIVIKQLPDSITQLKGLVSFDLYKCKKLRKLPEEIGNMKGLKNFSVRYTAIEQLPDSFGGLTNLERLDLSMCENLRNLPNSLWKLKLLKTLLLSECSKLEQLPEQLEKMQCLEWLDASHTAIEQVPDTIGLLSRLRELYIVDCKKLKFVPRCNWNLNWVKNLYLHRGGMCITSLPDSVKNMKKLTSLELSCNVRLCLPMILCFSSLEMLTLTDKGCVLSSAGPFSLSKLINLRTLTLYNCTSLGSSLPELPLNLPELRVYNQNSLEQLPDLSSLRKFKHLYIEGCISLQSISLIPSHLHTLSVIECTSLQDLPDLSVLKEFIELKVTRCNNLKSISLKQSFLQVGTSRLPFSADLPNNEVAEWFNYKSNGHTVSFDFPPSFGSNFLGLALWVVFTCKASKKNWAYMKPFITNETKGITKEYTIYVVDTVVGETESRQERSSR